MLNQRDLANLSALLDRTPITGREAEMVIGLKIKLADLARAEVRRPQTEDLGQDAAAAIK